MVSIIFIKNFAILIWTGLYELPVSVYALYSPDVKGHTTCFCDNHDTAWSSNIRIYVTADIR